MKEIYNQGGCHASDSQLLSIHYSTRCVILFQGRPYAARSYLRRFCNNRADYNELPKLSPMRKVKIITVAEGGNNKPEGKREGVRGGSNLRSRNSHSLT